MSKTLFQFSSVYRKHNKCQKIVNEMISDIIKKKMNEIIQNVDDKKTLDTDNYMCRKAKPVIEILLEHHHEMSYEQIRDEIVTIMIGNI